MSRSHVPSWILADADREIAEHKDALRELVEAYREAIADGAERTEATSVLMAEFFQGFNPMKVAGLAAVAVAALAESEQVMPS